MRNYKKISLFFLICSLAMPVQAFAVSTTVTIGSKASVTPTIELMVQGQKESELRFGNIAPSAASETVSGPMTMKVEVKSNTGERYQVTQNLANPLQNETGVAIPLENLSFTSRSENAGGTITEAPTKLISNHQTVYISDAQGKSATILIDYTLNVPANQAPGNYSATITYTASTL